MSISPGLHGWSSGYLKPAFLGWEVSDILTAQMATGAGRLVHHACTPPVSVHAGAAACLLQSGQFSGIMPWAGHGKAVLGRGRSNIVSPGETAMRAVSGKAVTNVTASPCAVSRSVIEERVALCVEGHSPIKTVRHCKETQAVVSE